MKVTIHTDSTTLPALPHGSYFHSRELMELCMRTPRHKPYMAVVTFGFWLADRKKAKQDVVVD